MITNWGQAQNNTGWGSIYNQSWVGEYIFLTVVGDGNDYSKRVSDDSGTMEAHTTLVGNLNYSLK
jgi:hypothetical protein